MIRPAIVLGLASLVLASGNPPSRGAEMPRPLHVAGTHVVDDRGERVHLRGVNAAGLEWSTTGEGHIRETVTTAVRDWHANVVRLPLNQDRWFGKARDQEDEGRAYRDLVKQVVDDCAGRGCYVVLDLHWSDAGEWSQKIGQHVMPDRHSVTFWKDLAAAYKDHPAVIFDLYNEPHDVTWDIWRNGGEVTEKDRKLGDSTFEAVGMQTLLDTVRAAGARNLVIVGGLNWSYDLSGVLQGKRLSDSDGAGVVYASHAYPFKGDTVERWVAKMETAAQEVPILIGEFGSEPPGAKGLSGDQWVAAVLQALESHQWDWIAWDMHPGAAPCLVSNWDYAPTPYFGAPVKQALLANVAPAQAPVPTPAPVAPIGLFEGHQDVGIVLHPGSAEFDAASKTYALTGSGANMWFVADAFHFLWRKASGDLALSADVAFPAAGTDPHRKACLMIRQTLDADSPYIDACVHGDGLTSLQFRDAKGAATHEVQANVTGPRRLRIEKRGKYVRMDLATEPGAAPRFSGAAARVAFEGPFYVGLGVCSHNKDVTERAVFSNVELTTEFAASAGPPTLYSTLETQALASTDRRVVQVTPARIEAPNWLKDGQTLIYNAGGRIYRIPATGGEPQVIDTGFAVRCNNDHGVSADGTLLAISDQSQGDRRSRIYTLPVSGGTPKLVTPTGPSYWHGWSPDGKTMAFCAERGGEFDIYSIPAEGGPETRLTTAQGLDDGPEFSPDGRTIFFNSDRTGTMQIWRMLADGSGQEPVTEDESNNWFPHPSPDGRTLVFLSFEKGVVGHPANQDVTLRRMTLDGKKVDILGRFFGGQGTVNVPCWSPDGRRIAFVTYQLVP